MSDYENNNDDLGWYYKNHNEISRRNWGKGRHFGNYGDNMNPRNGEGYNRRPEPGGDYNRIGPKGPGPLSGGAAKSLPKTEEYERIEPAERRFIDAPSLDLARGL